MITNRAPEPKLVASRHQLMAQADCRFLGRTEFCELLTSNKRLVRWDVATAGLRGVYDPDSGLRFLIEEEALFGDEMTSSESS